MPSIDLEGGVLKAGINETVCTVSVTSGDTGHEAKLL